MRRLFAMCLLLAGSGCAPTMRQILTEQTMQYTKCGHVVVECVDEACTNVAGGPWMATACATRYRCTNTAGQVVCAPEGSGPPQ